jgi:lysophospholipase L1-like esterase
MVKVVILASHCYLFAGLRADNIISAVGDSITSGYPEVREGDGCRCGGYVPKLESILDGRDWDSTVYNYGIAGDHADNAAARIPGVISQSDPDYVLFLTGTNDLWWVSPGTVRSRIEQAITNIKAGNKIAVVGTLLPDTRSNNNNTKRIPETNHLIRELVDDKSVQLAEFYNALSFDQWEDLMPDGLHPGNSGREVMAEIWYESLLFDRKKRTVQPAVNLLLLD